MKQFRLSNQAARESAKAKSSSSSLRVNAQRRKWITPLEKNHNNHNNKKNHNNNNKNHKNHKNTANPNSKSSTKPSKLLSAKDDNENNKNLPTKKKDKRQLQVLAKLWNKIKTNNHPSRKQQPPRNNSHTIRIRDKQKDDYLLPEEMMSHTPLLDYTVGLEDTENNSESSLYHVHIQNEEFPEVVSMITIMDEIQSQNNQSPPDNKSTKEASSKNTTKTWEGLVSSEERSPTITRSSTLSKQPPHNRSFHSDILVDKHHEEEESKQEPPREERRKTESPKSYGIEAVNWDVVRRSMLPGLSDTDDDDEDDDGRGKEEENEADDHQEDDDHHQEQQLKEEKRRSSSATNKRTSVASTAATSVASSNIVSPKASPKSWRSLPVRQHSFHRTSGNFSAEPPLSSTSLPPPPPPPPQDATKKHSPRTSSTKKTLKESRKIKYSPKSETKKTASDEGKKKSKEPKKEESRSRSLGKKKKSSSRSLSEGRKQNKRHSTTSSRGSSRRSSLGSSDKKAAVSSRSSLVSSSSSSKKSSRSLVSNKEQQKVKKQRSLSLDAEGKGSSRRRRSSSTSSKTKSKKRSKSLDRGTPKKKKQHYAQQAQEQIDFLNEAMEQVMNENEQLKTAFELMMTRMELYELQSECLVEAGVDHSKEWKKAIVENAHKYFKRRSSTLSSKIMSPAEEELSNFQDQMIKQDVQDKWIQRLEEIHRGYKDRVETTDHQLRTLRYEHIQTFKEVMDLKANANSEIETKKDTYSDYTPVSFSDDNVETASEYEQNVRDERDDDDKNRHKFSKVSRTWSDDTFSDVGLTASPPQSIEKEMGNQERKLAQQQRRWSSVDGYATKNSNHPITAAIRRASPSSKNGSNNNNNNVAPPNASPRSAHASIDPEGYKDWEDNLETMVVHWKSDDSSDGDMSSVTERNVKDSSQHKKGETKEALELLQQEIEKEQKKKKKKTKAKKPEVDKKQRRASAPFQLFSTRRMT